jgi:hypothetical protein
MPIIGMKGGNHDRLYPVPLGNELSNCLVMGKAGAPQRITVPSKGLSDQLRPSKTDGFDWLDEPKGHNQLSIDLRKKGDQK